MQTQTTMHTAGLQGADGLMDCAQIFSGAVLAVFTCMHMLFLSSVLFGAEAMNRLSAIFEAIHAEALGGWFIAVVFVVHMATVTRKIPFKAMQVVEMVRHARMVRHADTWRWIAQAVTGCVLMALVSIHLWTGLTDIPVVAQNSAARVQSGGWLIFYGTLLPILFLHLTIGIWRVAVKTGFITRELRLRARKMELYLLAGLLILASMTLIRLATLSV
ncbi:succinate dehydrogenase/fumarate reductase cytochrome b subunit [Oleidesulfovibrio sp.]|uniref:succinate dehydrogenase/fumarate reductase cytochrome b subunit n=1 Tax=Oleidesulfovibrio sp. TaxID=2909707 RepID=UPI003A8BFF49